MRPAFVFSFSMILAAGCAQFPEVEGATEPALADAPYPTLVPVEDVLDQEPPRLDETSEAVLQGRVNRLKRRAADLSNTPIE